MEFVKLILENPIAAIAIIVVTSLGISKIILSFRYKKCKCKKTESDKILKS